MDNVIYHSRDLDGLMSGAIVHNYQTSYWEPCTLFPYDYGELLDTRKFKGKSAVMIDVSMPMDRMELLSTSCMEFMWIDHHISAYNDLMEYCTAQSYEVTQRKINDLINCTEVNKMNLTYYYSNRLSGCEIAAIIFDKNLQPTSKKLIQLLGQYDTWRKFEDKKFINDEDWNDVVLPFQYGMRAKFNDPVKISDYLEKLNNYDKHRDRTDYIFTDIQELGISIIKYQENLDETNIKNNSFEMDFDFEGKTYKAVCLNSTVFNSNLFKSVYYEEYHDIMIAFQYNGKIDKYKFSMYTTKENVNILSIAKSFGGGGHPQACGFEIAAANINIQKSIINIFNNKKADIPKNIGTLVFEDDVTEEENPLWDAPQFEDVITETKETKEETKVFEKPSIPKGYALKEDGDGHYYWIPIVYAKKFETAIALIIGKEYMDCPDDFDAFNEEFGKFATGGAPDICPQFLYEKLKDKLQIQ